jgi:16S rRNA G966 N2-methylase RsmD
MVEISRASLTALRANVAALDAEERVRVHRADALRFAGALGAQAYDVALADPPYTSAQAERVVSLFRARAFAAVLGVEHSASTVLLGDETRRYGDVALTFCYAP